MATNASDLFIVDNSDSDWKVRSYLKDWCELSRAIDIATGYFEIGALLTLEDQWQSVEKIRILMGDEVSLRTKHAFVQGLQKISNRLDASLETEKSQNDFLKGVPAIVEAIRSGKIECRVFRKDKFHAKAYLTHGKAAVIGSFGLVGSSNFTYPGLTGNVELNVQIRGPEVGLLQECYERHWNEVEDVSPDLLRTLERHTRNHDPFEVWAKVLEELMRDHELTTEAELIDGDPATHPKARIRGLVPTYKEVADGATILGKIGIEPIRAACPHFAQWLGQLEALGTSAG